LALDAAKNALDLAKQQLIKAKSLVGTTSLYHHPQIQQAEVNLRNAYLNWRRTVIYAPENGMVAKRFVQVGQQINANSVLMVIVPLDQVWVDANFKESQLRDIRIGQPVSMIADAYGGKVEFKGEVVGLNPGTGSVFDILPPQNATGNWIKIVQRLPVRIAISRDQLKEHPLQIGLSMTVTVDTHDRKGEPLHKEKPLHILYHSQDVSSDIKAADKIIESILQENAKNIEPLSETSNL
jgi:membrane fusion protein (multidrug efflux system)